MSRLAVTEQFFDHLRMLQAESDLFRLMEDVTAEIGFRYFALLNHVDLSNPPDHAVFIGNYPSAWAEYFIENRLFLEDPILRASMTTHVGFHWHDVPKMIGITSRQQAILDRAARHGLGSGFTIPANIPGESHGSCSFATRQGVELPSKNLLLAQLIGAFAFQAARRLKQGNALSLRPAPRLTPRQRDCLLWAIRGKTDWEISRILGLSQETVSQHLDMARERYNVTKRMPLAVRAIFDGQISFMEAFARQFPLKRE